MLDIGLIMIKNALQGFAMELQLYYDKKSALLILKQQLYVSVAQVVYEMRLKTKFTVF